MFSVSCLYHNIRSGFNFLLICFEYYIDSFEIQMNAFPLLQQYKNTSSQQKLK